MIDGDRGRLSVAFTSSHMLKEAFNAAVTHCKNNVRAASHETELQSVEMRNLRMTRVWIFLVRVKGGTSFRQEDSETSLFSPLFSR